MIKKANFKKNGIYWELYESPDEIVKFLDSDSEFAQTAMKISLTHAYLRINDVAELNRDAFDILDNKEKFLLLKEMNQDQTDELSRFVMGHFYHYIS
ncbi:MAG: hypothetical protein V7735_17255 [Photobacterium frigidiphilum]|uniref:hypothetical protein n=1 Tax=Photobacterium frigidiphilum TaxID=264736 RepID=UPI0030017B01